MTRPPKTRRALRRFAILAAGLPLAACGADRTVTGSTYSPDYRQRHPMVLAEGARTLDVFVNAASGLDPRQREDVVAFAIEYRRYGHGPLMAQMPAGAKMDAETVLNMGIKAFNANQMDKAFGYFDQVVKDHPERSDAYYYRGLVYLNKGKHAEAKADFQKVLQLDPNGKFADDAKAFLKDIK